MLCLAPATTLQGFAAVANAVTLTIFGMERTVAGGAQVYKVLYQGQLPASVTTLYTAPSGTEALIRSMCLVNLDDLQNTVSLFYNGSAAANRLVPPIYICPHGMVQYEDGGMCEIGVRGGILTSSYTQPQDAAYAATHAETLDRSPCTEQNVSALVSGRLTLQAIWLTAGQIIRWITFFSGSTAAGTPTNQIFGLYSVSGRVLLATTVNDTTTAWGAAASKRLRVTTPYTVPTTGLYYVGIMVTATTVPTLKGLSAVTGGQLAAASPILMGTSNTGLTTALPDPANALTATLSAVWGAVG